jgi:hypothetical protein
MAVFVLVLLTGMGAALLFLSQSEIKMSQANLRAKEAFSIAEAGLEFARMSFYNENKGDPFDDDLIKAAHTNGKLEFDPAAIAAVYDGNGNVTGFTGYGDDEPLVPLTAFEDGWFIAFLTNDPDEPNPRRYNKADTNNKVIITSIGAGPDRSLEIVEAVIELHPIFPAVPPATITILGPDPHFDGGWSMAKDYMGDDCGGTGAPGLFAPIVGVVDPNAVVDPCPDPKNPTSVTCGIHQPNTYETGSGTYVGNDTAADVSDPSVIGGIGPIDKHWVDCQFLHDLAEEIRYAADVVCTPYTSCTWPPDDPARVIFIDGDWALGPKSSGSGLLFVTGTLVMDGQASWKGMIYVVGQGVFVRQGAGNGVISGALFAADIAGPDNVYGTKDDCTGPDAGFDSAYVDESGGGNGETVYCSKDLNPALPVRPYEIVDFVQR